MQKSILLFLMILIGNHSFSQNFEWGVRIGSSLDDIGSSITSDISGNIIISGCCDITRYYKTIQGATYYTHSTQKIFVSKSDASGKSLWSMSIGGDTDCGSAGSVVTDNKGNIYITGGYKGFIDFDPGSSVHHLDTFGNFIAKYDSSGKYIWATTTSKSASGSSIAVDLNDNVYIVNDNGCYLFETSKFDKNGNLIWTKDINCNSSIYANSIKTDASSNVYITGEFTISADFDPSFNKFELTACEDYCRNSFILKLNTNGSLVWAKSFKGTKGSNGGKSIALDKEGNIYTAGYFNQTVDFDPGESVFNITSTPDYYDHKSDNDDVYIVKLNSMGSFIWAKSLSGESGQWPKDITVDTNDNIFVTGNFTATIDFDPDSGIHYLSASHSNDIYILKLDSAGKFKYVKRIGGPEDDYSGGITTDKAGNVYITGDFQSTVDFDPGKSTYNYTSKGEGDIFIIKLGTNGASDIQKNELGIAVYPVPATDIINIEIQPEIINDHFTIIDMQGRCIMSGTIAELKTSVNVSLLNRGIYILSIGTGTGNNYKIIKE